MCMPCCNVCYEKYINEDGTIDEVRLLRVLGFGEFIDTNDVVDYDQLVPILKQNKYPSWCKCDCHKDGSGVMH